MKESDNSQGFPCELFCYGEAGGAYFLRFKAKTMTILENVKYIFVT